MQKDVPFLIRKAPKISVGAVVVVCFGQNSCAILYFPTFRATTNNVYIHPFHRVCCVELEIAYLAHPIDCYVVVCMLCCKWYEYVSR